MGKYFGDLKIGQKKCPKMKKENTLWQKCILYSIIEFYGKTIF
jgi:hypothetical protein